MKQLTEIESKKLLKQNDIPIPRGDLAKNELEAKNLASSIYGRAVMKIVSSDIVHKSEFGGVVLNVDYHDAPIIYAELIEKAKKIGAKVDGVLIEEMLSGHEIIIGLKKDSQFGLVIMVGLGGIYAEIYKDVSFRVAPITVDDAQQMLEELKGYKILRGIRGKEKANMTAIRNAIVNVSNLKNIIELDINPLICNSERAVAADARILME